MRVPLYGRDRMCRDCYVKANAAAATTKAVVHLNYKGMSQDDLVALVAEYKSYADAATTKAEKHRWQNKARSARSWLPPQECALPGCTVMCEGGNEYCSMRCAGKAAAGSLLRFVEQKRDTSGTGEQDFYNETPHPIHGEVDALFGLPVWQTPIYNPMEAKVMG